jgi:uncharacterized protein with HEPN domain
MPDAAAFLADARDYARRGAAYVRDVDSAAFASDRMRRDAVCFCLVIVGEACNEAARQLKTLPPEIPWGEIKGMRNILVHQYWQIDEVVIYNAARNEAEPLADLLEQLIERYS